MPPETRKSLKAFVPFKTFGISASLLKKVLFDDRNRYILPFTIPLAIRIFLFLICTSFFANETSNPLRLRIEIDRRFAFNFDTCKTFFICTFWPSKSIKISPIHLTCSTSSLIMMTMVRVFFLKTNNDSSEIMCLLTPESMIHVLSESVFLTAKAKFDVIQTFSEFFSSSFFWAARADLFFLLLFIFLIGGFSLIKRFRFFFFRIFLAFINIKSLETFHFYVICFVTEETFPIIFFSKFCFIRCFFGVLIIFYALFHEF